MIRRRLPAHVRRGARRVRDQRDLRVAIAVPRQAEAHIDLEPPVFWIWRWWGTIGTRSGSRPPGQGSVVSPPPPAAPPPPPAGESDTAQRKGQVATMPAMAVRSERVAMLRPPPSRVPRTPRHLGRGGVRRRAHASSGIGPDAAGPAQCPADRCASRSGNPPRHPVPRATDARGIPLRRPGARTRMTSCAMRRMRALRADRRCSKRAMGPEVPQCSAGAHCMTLQRLQVPASMAALRCSPKGRIGQLRGAPRGDAGGRDGAGPR